MNQELENKILAAQQKERDEQMLMGYCQKILKGIEEPMPNREQRAFWELVQNARDISEDCHIEIRLYPDRLEFAHQGEPFVYRTLLSLVIQNSSKNAEDKEKAGQYGTGFMTTHAFNTVVRIDSTYEIKDEQGNTIAYYPIDGFTLDRRGGTVREIFDKMRVTIQEMNAIIHSEPLAERRLWTVFTYELSEQKANALSGQLDAVMRLIPFVIVVNKRIAEFSIQNHVSQTSCRFTRDVNVGIKEYANEKGWTENTYVVHAATSNGTDEKITCHALQSATGNDVVFIPPFDARIGDVNTIPSLVLWFPLIGSEDFGVNFVFHSDQFYPVEARNNIQLPNSQSANGYKYQQNEKVLNEMFEALRAYYMEEAHAETLPIDWCRVHFPLLGKEDDEESKRFYDEQQDRWVNVIQSWHVVPTEDGYLRVNDRRLRVLAPEFYEGLSEEKQQQYEPIMRHYASQVLVNAYGEEKIILPKENLIQWSKTVAEWRKDMPDTFVTLRQVCERIKGNSETLHQFLDWIKEIRQENLFDEFALIPNREGKLYKRKELKTGTTIPDALYAIARPIITTELDKVVDPAFADISELTEYTRADLRDQISSALRGKRIEEWNEDAFKSVKHKIDYCSAFVIESSNSVRWRLMPIICELFGYSFEPIMIPNEPKNNDERPVELYETCFNYLVEDTMNYISCQGEAWLKAEGQKTENYRRVLRFVEEYANSSEGNKENMERLLKYAIFPNQLYQLCKADALKKNTSVKPDFAALYDNVTGKKIESEWVEDDFGEFYTFEEQKAKVLGRELEEEKFRPYLDDKRAKKEGFEVDEEFEKYMLTVINKIESDDWRNYFDYFAQEDNLRNISYELGTDDQKKALYKIKMGISSQATLDKLAELAEHPNIDAILSKAEDVLRQEVENRRQFHFNYEIGTLIEREVREQISSELKVDYSKTLDQYTASNEQNGQDIVIRRGEEELFFIECKAKWNFSVEKAHMSSQQIKQAVRRNGRYALVCVDCTRDTGCDVQYDATSEQVHAAQSEIIAHTHVHLDIGNQFRSVVGAQVNYEDKVVCDEEKEIRLYSSLSCNIPKPVFISGKTFGEFVDYLREKLLER